MIIEIPLKILERVLLLNKNKESMPISRKHIEKYYGMLKDKITIDPLEYQNKIRYEWD